MANSNIYRFSTRDGEKFLTQNGIELKMFPKPDWGWYGADTSWTAFHLLFVEYGVETANKYFARFAREYLAEMDCDSFTWTSGAIAFMIKKLETT